MDAHEHKQSERASLEKISHTRYTFLGLYLKYAISHKVQTVDAQDSSHDGCLP